jgi:6-phosphogluconate dehydrogenase (decarboxylating)
MQLGMIGLGRMGANMTMRLIKAGHECTVHDSHPEPVQALVKQGAKGSTSLTVFVKSLAKPRTVWLMVPAAAVEPVLASLTPLLETGDIVIDVNNLRKGFPRGSFKIHHDLRCGQRERLARPNINWHTRPPPGIDE